MASPSPFPIPTTPIPNPDPTPPPSSTATATATATAAAMQNPSTKPSSTPSFYRPTKSSAAAASSSANSSNPSKLSPVSSHLQMIELKNHILSSLNKLADRDTHALALEELHQLSLSLNSPDSQLPLFLNSLYDSSDSHQKPIVRKHSLRILTSFSQSHTDLILPHVPKIVTHIVRRLKDPDSTVRDACAPAAAVLSQNYIAGKADGGGAVLGLIVKPFVEAMGENNKVVQAGAAMCLSKIVESGGNSAALGFVKLCPRVCKCLGSQSFLAKGAVLGLAGSLAQVGAISATSVPTLMPCIHECLESSDWSTRKAAADALISLATHSSQLIGDGGLQTINTLENCHFDKVKPVRDSINEALQLWKNVTRKNVDENAGVLKDMPSEENKNPDALKSTDKPDLVKSIGVESNGQDPPRHSVSSVDSKGQISSLSEKAASLLKKKPPILNDQELNPEFFQNLEARPLCDDLPVEVLLPRKFQSSQSQAEDKQTKNADEAARSGAGDANESAEKRDAIRDKWTEQRNLRGKDLRLRALDSNDKADNGTREVAPARAFSRSESVLDNSLSKGNWLGIQKQLTLLERQQSHIMNMLHEFMGGSHDSMVTLENRVRGLERIVEDMARDLSSTTGRRGTSTMLGFEGSSVRALGKYNGFADYTNSKLARGGEGRFPDRFTSPDGGIVGSRGRDPAWRSDAGEAWDSYGYGTARNGPLGSRRTMNVASGDGRSSRNENDDDQAGSRRAWDKGPGSVRLGEGPSARSVWQASKDEATLEAIRGVSGEDNGISRMPPRVAIPELTAEAMTDDGPLPDKGPVWDEWTSAMDALQAGDIDSAYADVLSTGDDLLLVKLMDRSGPVMDQLSNEVASEVLSAITQFLQEHSLLDIGLSWIQQMLDIMTENNAYFLGIPFESKKELLLSLHDAASMELPDDWEGALPDEMLVQLAAAWGLNLQQLEK